MKVLGIGNALVDVLALIDDDTVLDNMRLPKGSMQLIDGEGFDIIKDIIDGIAKKVASGGSASNTIASLGKLGIQTGFIGKIGDDKFGNYYKEDLDSYNVEPHLIKVKETSGVSSIFISKDGERTFATFLGAAATLKPDELDKTVFSGYDYLYIEGYLVQDLNLIQKALILAKNTGLKIALDLASYNIVEENRDFLLEIIPEYVDILFGNKEEIKSLTGLDPEDASEKIAPWVDIVVVKTGPEGSIIQKGQEKVSVPVDRIEPVDTTGAGDLYAAGFLYGLIKGYSMEQCGRTGSLLAKNIIQVVGAKMENDRWENIKKILD